jgi:hypothetical protein
LWKLFIQRPHRPEQSYESALPQWLDHKTISIAMHDCFVARQLELYRYAHCLVSAIAE